MKTPLKDQMKMRTLRDGQWWVVPVAAGGLAVLAVGVALFLKVMVTSP